MEVKFKECLCFDDVILVPQYSKIKSRKDIDISNVLDKRLNIGLQLPIISTPMDTITEDKMCITMNDMGGLGIVHRNNTIEEQVKIIKEINSEYLDYFTLTDETLEKYFLVGAAIGINGDYFERTTELVKHGVDVICIDVAHGHHQMMKETIKKIKDNFSSIHLMAGNVATRDAFHDLGFWGADSIRVGIGCGSVCTTSVQTGHGKPVLSSLLECDEERSLHKELENVKIICDGGIRSSGDMCKAFAAGADFVMCGSLLSSTYESPGETIVNNGEMYKEFRGMASRSAKMVRGDTSSPEGVEGVLIPLKGSVRDVLKDIDGGIRSGLSYSGARNINEFQIKAKFVKQTNRSYEENKPHILRRV